MNRRIGWLLLPFMFVAGAALAQTGPSHEPIGLGFRSMDAPIGMRWWLTNGNVAVDVGLGFGSEENTAVDESLSHWAFEVGIPIVIKSWDSLHFLVRPGIMYRSQEAVVQTVPTVDTDTDSELSILAELEAEVFLAKNFSVSAAHGLAFVNRDPAVGESSTDWGTTGSNFTHVGFHVYLWGGGGQ